MYKPFSFFPLMTAFTGLPNKYYFDALEESCCYVAPISDVMELLQNEPTILFDVTHRIFTGMQVLLDKVEVLTYGTAEQKIAYVLHSLFRQFSDDSRSKRLPFILTHEDIGDFAGVSRETVTRVMGKLIEDTIIEVREHHIVLISPDKLKNLLPF